MPSIIVLPTGSTTSYVQNGITGIWNSVGCLPIEGESISISVEDSKVLPNAGSLRDIVGFPTEDKQIGKFAGFTPISELVIMLPMVYDYNSDGLRFIWDWTPPIWIPKTTPPAVDPCAPCVDVCNTDSQASDDSSTSGHGSLRGYREKGLSYNEIEKAWLFTIDESRINDILGVIDYKQLSIYQIKEILDNKITLNRSNNIVKLMIYMTQYNFPPHLNWLLNTSLPAYAMYCARFSYNLSQASLVDIWQGTMPKIAKEPIEEEIVIEHYLDDDEIFGGYKITENQFDIKLKVFKAKKRAKNNYEKDLVDTKQRLANPKNEGWYQYNWPYDFFSLVELLKIEQGEIRDYLYIGGDVPFNITREIKDSFGNVTHYTADFTKKPSDWPLTMERFNKATNVFERFHNPLAKNLPGFDLDSKKY